MVTKLFEQALGVETPWYVSNVDFDPAKKLLTIEIDFIAGSRFAVVAVEDGINGTFPAYDTEIKQYRHLSFFQHDCILSVRVPRVQLPDGRTRVITVPWSGKLRGFTLLFEAFVLLLIQHGMNFADAARTAHCTPYQAQEIAVTYTDEAADARSLAEVTSIAVDETSRAKGHRYVSLVADTDTRAVIDVQPGKDADVLEGFAKTLAAHGGEVPAITDICMDMSPAFISGAQKHFPAAQITFDKFHVVYHASKAVDATRREERRTTPALAKTRWLFLKDHARLTAAERKTFESLRARGTALLTVRAWHYKEWLREILDHKQPNVVASILDHWCRCVMRSKVTAMKEVVALIRRHRDGILRWTRSQITNGFLEALNGIFQTAKRKARGYTNFRTIRAVIFLIAGKLDYTTVNTHCFQPT
jgi:transposase